MISAGAREEIGSGGAVVVVVTGRAACAVVAVGGGGGAGTVGRVATDPTRRAEPGGRARVHAAALAPVAASPVTTPATISVGPSRMSRPDASRSGRAPPAL